MDAEARLQRELSAAMEVNDRCEALCAAAMRAKEEIYSLRHQLVEARDAHPASARSRSPPPSRGEAEREALEGQVASLRAELVQLYQWLSMKREEETSKSPMGSPERYSPPASRGEDLQRLGRSHNASRSSPRR